MKWISIKDSLPPIEEDSEYSKNVLITDGECVCSGFLCHWGDDDIEFDIKYGGAGFDSDWDELESKDVTHWMPLPEPPEKDRAPMSPEEKNWEEVRQKNIRIQLENLPDFDREAWDRMVEEKE